MTNFLEKIESVRNKRGMYCLYSGKKYVGEVRYEWISRVIKEMPELFELLEELINPDREPGVDTCNYVRKKLNYVKGILKEGDEKAKFDN